jgi:hypothetical protein
MAWDFHRNCIFLTHGMGDPVAGSIVQATGAWQLFGRVASIVRAVAAYGQPGF